MSVRRIKQYPFPRNLKTTEDIGGYLQNLYRALHEEATERITDFSSPQIAETPWVDVRTFEARVDGTTDDTSRVQAAINSLTSGGMVWFPVGTCVVGKLTLLDNVWLVGVGWGSVLKLKASTNDDMIYATGKHGIKVSNLTLDGDKDNQTVLKSCVRLDSCYASSVEDCYIHDAKYAGIQFVSSYGVWAAENYLEDNAVVGVMLSAVTKSMVTENYITTDTGGFSGYHGILFYNGSTHNVADANTIYCSSTGTYGITGVTVYLNSHYNTISDNVTYLCGNGIEITQSDYCTVSGNFCENAQGRTGDEAGIELNDSLHNIVDGNMSRNNKMSGIYILGASDYNTITGNHCYGNYGSGINIQSSDYNIMSDNHCLNNSGRGVKIYEADYSEVSGNMCVNNGQAGAFAGIELDDSTYNIISENICTDNQATKTQTYGIEEKVTSDWNLIHDNIVIGNKTGGLSITGANTVDTDNLEPS
jgi:parallel beta-helix repeat protein